MGQVAERLNALVSKTSMAFGSSWVRIPPCPLPLPGFSSLGNVVFGYGTDSARFLSDLHAITEGFEAG